LHAENFSVKSDGFVEIADSKHGVKDAHDVFEDVDETIRDCNAAMRLLL
jgi:hypothetical protein